MRFIAALILGMQAQDAAKVPIAWTLKNGDKVRYEFDYSVVSKESGHVDEVRLVIGVALEATDVGKDGTTVVKATFDRFAMTKSGHGNTMEYDSRREGDPPSDGYAKVLSKCVGNSFNMPLVPSGKISAVDDLKRIIQAAVDSFPELKAKHKWSAGGVDRAARTLAIALNLGFETPRGAPAAVGDTWEVRFEDKRLTQGAGAAVRRAKLKEIRGGQALVEQTVTFDLPEEFAEAAKESSGKGSLWWDTEKGLLKSLNTTIRIKAPAGEVTVTLSVLQAPAPAKKD